MSVLYKLLFSAFSVIAIAVTLSALGSSLRADITPVVFSGHFANEDQCLLHYPSFRDVSARCHGLTIFFVSIDPASFPPINENARSYNL